MAYSNELMSVNSALGGEKASNACPEGLFKHTSGINCIPLESIRLSVDGF
jgi:hypothetical protein